MPLNMRLKVFSKGRKRHVSMRVRVCVCEARGRGWDERGWDCGVIRRSDGQHAHFDDPTSRSSLCIYRKKVSLFLFLLCVCVGVHGFVWECVRVCETCDLLLSESLTRWPTERITINKSIDDAFNFVLYQGTSHTWLWPDFKQFKTKPNWRWNHKPHNRDFNLGGPPPRQMLNTHNLKRID